MRDDFGVSLGRKFGALLLELLAQLAKILDDAVVHDRDILGGVRMRVVLVRLAVGRPAGMADADIASERIFAQPRFQVPQLAFGTPALKLIAFERRDTCGIIAAIFEPL